MNSNGVAERPRNEGVYEQAEFSVPLQVQPERAQAADRPFYEAVKRTSDVFFSLFMLVLSFPLCLVTAFAVKLEDGGQIIYTQMRAGKHGKPFKMYKFRSMYPNADEKRTEILFLNEKDGPVFKIKADPRITRVGRILRKTSIDEIPQLINVLRGDMSIVGPRPAMLNEVEKYTPYQMRRLEVKPGLTCYWQVSGRSNLNFDKWVTLDVEYINSRSVLTDIKIMLRTIPAVLSGRGAY